MKKWVVEHTGDQYTVREAEGVRHHDASYSLETFLEKNGPEHISHFESEKEACEFAIGLLKGKIKLLQTQISQFQDRIDAANKRGKEQ